MKNRKLATLWFFIALGCFAFSLFGSIVPGVFLAAGVVFLILSYAANQKPSNNSVTTSDAEVNTSYKNGSEG